MKGRVLRLLAKLPIFDALIGVLAVLRARKGAAESGFRLVCLGSGKVWISEEVKA